MRWVTDWSSGGQSDKFWNTDRQSTNGPNLRGVCCNYPIRFSPKHPLPKYSLYLSRSIFSYTPRKTKDINKSKYKFNIFSNKLNRTLEGDGNFFFFFFFFFKFLQWNYICTILSKSSTKWSCTWLKICLKF